jgi:hypothetical protein
MRDKLALDLPRQGSGSHAPRDGQSNIKNASAQSTARGGAGCAPKPANAKDTSSPSRSRDGGKKADAGPASPAKVRLLCIQIIRAHILVSQ